MPRATLRAVVPVLLAGLAAWPMPAAEAQVRRCVGPDGGTIYTDRPCSAVGATSQPQGRTHARAQAYRGGCQRQLRGLIQEMSHAIHAGDTNRLAALYHWRGLSHSGGYRILDRLDAIAQRPLHDIVAQRPAAPRIVASSGTFSGWVSARDIPTAAPEPPPTSLRVEQGGTDGSGPTRTVFGLHRHLGCWWVSL